MSKKPSRLRGLSSSIVSQIKPEKFDEVEREFNNAIKIHDPDAKASLWVLAHYKLNPQNFNGKPERGENNQPDEPAGVENPKDVLHKRPDFNAMSPQERLAWAHNNPAQAAALLDGAKRRGLK